METLHKSGQIGSDLVASLGFAIDQLRHLVSCARARW